MIRGTVTAAHEAKLPIRIHGPTGTVAVVDALIDTGFTSSLVLPPALVVRLGLKRRSGGRAALADGTVRRYETFGAEVEWDGIRRGVVVAAVGSEVLVGMGLLAGYEMRMEIEPDGRVEIKPLRRN
jgi:clan AA aspartic protease